MSATPGTDSAVTMRRSLGRRLRALREAAKIPQTGFERRVGSRWKINRLETGEGPYRTGDIREFCRIVGAGEAETEELVSLAEHINDDRIWDDVTDLLPGSFGTLVDLEAVANRLSMWQPEVMPGLLQTPQYARAVFEASAANLAPEQVERLSEVRARRQKGVLTRRPAIRAVLDEAVIARQVGGADVMAGQLQHLQDLVLDGAANISVLPLAAGAHAAMDGPFTILEFPDFEEPTVVYVESRAGARILNKSEPVTAARATFDRLVERSVPIEEHITRERRHPVDQGAGISRSR